MAEDILRAIGQLLASNNSRLEFIRPALKLLIAQMINVENNVTDLAIIEQHVDVLNKEAFDVLAYQGTSRDLQVSNL